MNLYVLVRDSQPYQDLDRDSWLYWTNGSGTLTNHFRDRILRLIDRWEEASGVSYFEYRGAVRDLAVRNWERIEGLRDIVWYRAGGFRPALDPRGIYLMVDDDDWFSPMISSSLEFRDFSVWEIREFVISNDVSRVQGLESGFVPTNGGAVSGRRLAALNGPDFESLLYNHMCVRRIAEAQGWRWSLRPGVWGASPKHLASMSTFDHHRGDFREVARRSLEFRGVRDQWDLEIEELLALNRRVVENLRVSDPD